MLHVYKKNIPFCFLSLLLETLTNLNENFSHYRVQNADSTCPQQFLYLLNHC